METECEKVETNGSDKKCLETKMDFGDKTGRTRRKLIKMRIQPASVFVDEGEDKIEVGKVRIYIFYSKLIAFLSILKQDAMNLKLC